MNRPILPAALLSLCAAALSAQAPPPPLSLPIQPETIDGRTELWAGGEHYKVRFDQDITFIPQLGELAPVNAEFRWHTLALATADGPEIPASSEPFTYTDHLAVRNLSFASERYEVLAHGVEQTFVFAQRPNLAGDLMIRGAIQGNLRTEDRSPQHAAMVWRDNLDRPVVEYGAAFAIDAAGRVTALATSKLDREIRIHLPGSLLAEASFPLTIDPMLAPRLITTAAPGQSVLGTMVMARTNQQVPFPIAIAYRRIYSATDADINVSTYADDYSSEQLIFRDSSDANNDEFIDVAVGDGGTTWVVAWSRSAAAEPAFYHLHGVTDREFSTTQYALTRPWGNHDSRPRIGGNLSGSSPNVLIVRERFDSGSSASTIVAGLLNLRTRQETAFTLSSSAQFTTASHPAINKDAAGTHWLAAWQSSSTLIPRHQLIARRIDVSGNVATATITSDRSAAPVHEIAPRIDGSLGRYTIVYGEVDQGAHPGLITGDEAMSLRTLRVNWPVLGALVVLPSQEIAASTQRRLHLMDTAFDNRTRSHWGVAWLDTVAEHLEFAVTGMTGRKVRTQRIHQATATEPGLWASVAFAPDSERFRIHYLTGTANQSWAYERDEMHPDNPVSLYGVPNCSNATPEVAGRFLRGNEFASVQLSNAAPNQPAIMFLSTGAANLALDPIGFTHCNLLVDAGPALLASLPITTNAAGFARHTIPLPETIGTFDLFAQWAQLAPGANPGGVIATYGLQIRVR